MRVRHVPTMSAVNVCNWYC